MAVVWNLYFMVAVGRKLLWILFREIRHAALKLQSVLRRASPVHCRCQNSQQCSEPKALLRKAALEVLGCFLRQLSVHTWNTSSISGHFHSQHHTLA